MKQITLGDVDKALLKWFCEARNNNIALSGPILLEKAQQLSVKLNGPEFKVTASWIDRWKLRHNVNKKIISGEEKISHHGYDIFVDRNSIANSTFKI